MALSARVGVVVATRDRRAELLRTLAWLEALPERPPIVVVDNGSADGTVRAVAEHHPGVRVIALGENRGAGARTLGVEALTTPYVAFADDDSWWQPRALSRIATLFDAHPRIALLAARVLVGPDDRLDPVCVAMRDSPIAATAELPGVPVLGFVACGAAVRREAFLAVGGFDARYGIGGEEEPLALALAAAGWELRYVDDVVAHHHPQVSGPRPDRRVRQARNEAWTLWLHRPARRAVSRTLQTVARGDGSERRGVVRALRGLPWVLRERQVIPAAVEHDVRRLEEATDGAAL